LLTFDFCKFGESDKEMLAMIMAGKLADGESDEKVEFIADLFLRVACILRET